MHYTKSGRINECAKINNPRKSWSLINDLLGKKRKSNSITELRVNDVTISKDNLIAETFNDFFIHIGSKLASEIDGQLPNESDPEGIINSNIPHLNRFEFSAISQDLVYHHLNSDRIHRTFLLVPSKLNFSDEIQTDVWITKNFH